MDNEIFEEAEEVNENETAENENENEEQNTEPIDYSASFEDIISNQEAIILQNEEIISNLQMQNNALLGITNLFTLSCIVVVAIFIVKNIFAKLF